MATLRDAIEAVESGRKWRFNDPAYVCRCGHSQADTVFFVIPIRGEIRRFCAECIADFFEERGFGVKEQGEEGA